MNTTTAAPEFETYTATIKAGAARDGDMLTSDPAMRRIRKVKAATKWTELRTEDGALILRTLSDSDIEVYRERETQASRDAALLAIRIEKIQSAMDDRETSLRKAQAAVNEALTAGNYADYSTLGNLIEAQSEHKVWAQFARLVEVAKTNEKSSLFGLNLAEQFDQYSDHLRERFFETHQHRALSRSTNQVSNLLEDSDLEAVANFLSTGRWYR